MLLEAFFRVCIYGFCVLIFLSCSAQKNVSKDSGIESSKSNNLSQTSSADSIKKARNEVLYSEKEYDMHLANAKRSIAKGDTNEAIQQYMYAIHVNPSGAEAYKLKGYLHLAKNEYNFASTDLQNAVEAGLEDADLYSKLGFSYSRVEKYTDAINYLNKAITLQPENLENYAHRAFAFVETEQYERAEADYKLFLLKNSDDAVAWFNIARAQYGMKKFDASILSLQKVIGLLPEFPNAYFKLGLAYAGKQDYENALQSFDKAILQSPNTGFLYFNRGIAKGKLKRNDFCPDFKKAVELGYTDAVKMTDIYCK